MAAEHDRHDVAKTPLRIANSEPESNGRRDIVEFDGRLRIRLGPKTQAAGWVVIASLLIAGIVQIALAVVARWNQ